MERVGVGVSGRGGVAVVDLDLLFGDVAFYLDMDVREPSLLDLLRDYPTGPIPPEEAADAANGVPRWMTFAGGHESARYTDLRSDPTKAYLRERGDDDAEEALLGVATS